MALKDGHHKTKRREGTRNCFYCRHDVTKWVPLTWPHIKELYDHCGVTCPTALCCEDCQKNKSNEELFKIFWATIISLECMNYRDKKPTIIKDEAIYKQFLALLKQNKQYLMVDIEGP